MRAVTIKDAKAHLNELVEAATSGEQVVLMRGSKHVAAIVPLSADEIEISPRLSDEQALRFWQRLAKERREGRLLSFPSADKAVGFLRRPPRRRSPSKHRG